MGEQMKAFKDWMDQEASEMAEHLEHTKDKCDKDIALLNMVKGRLNGILACKERFEEMNQTDTRLVDRELFFPEE